MAMGVGAATAGPENARMSMLVQAVRYLEELVLPGGCQGCGCYLERRDGPWCTACALQLGQAVQKPCCPRCGLTCEQGKASPAAGCPQCMGHRIAFDGFARVGDYASTLGSLVRRYKYRRQQQLDRWLGDLLSAAIERQPWWEEVEALVPVPLSWRSRLAYGFSPPQLLARHAGRTLGVPVLPMLREKGKRRPQVGLTPAQRRRNVRGVYRLRRGARPAGAIVCVIDDVSTTGATLQEVAHVLKKAGATRVYAAVLAKTNPEHAGDLRA